MSANVLAEETVNNLGMLPQLPTFLPEAVRTDGLALLERVRSVLSDGIGIKIGNIALFKKLANPDPVIAVEIAGQWYSIYEWE